MEKTLTIYTNEELEMTSSALFNHLVTLQSRISACANAYPTEHDALKDSYTALFAVYLRLNDYKEGSPEAMNEDKSIKACASMTKEGRA